MSIRAASKRPLIYISRSMQHRSARSNQEGGYRPTNALDRPSGAETTGREA